MVAARAPVANGVFVEDVHALVVQKLDEHAEDDNDVRLKAGRLAWGGKRAVREHSHCCRSHSSGPQIRRHTHLEAGHDNLLVHVVHDKRAQDRPRVDKHGLELGKELLALGTRGGAAVWKRRP